jgi:type VI secretion system protein ImpK
MNASTFPDPFATGLGAAPGFPDPRPAQAAEPALPPLAPGLSREERAAALARAQAEGRNVLIEAAAPLLRALAEVPEQLDATQVQAWHKLLHEELLLWTQLCEQFNLRREHLLAARYMLCTALDEAASLARWNADAGGQGAGMWSQMALLPEFHGERAGGEVVFMLLGRMAQSPAEHRPVLELMHHILALGFMGNYRVQAEGQRQLDAIRQRLFTLITEGQNPPPRELSPNWRGLPPGKLRIFGRFPLYLSAAILALVLCIQFLWARLDLNAALRERVAAVAGVLQSPAPTVSPASALNTLLSEEIAAGRVKLIEEPRRVLVVFSGDGMFAQGKAELDADSLATIRKVGQVLRTVPQTVQVWGHTDNQPDPDPGGINRRLSLARAQAVAGELARQGFPVERLIAEGKGGDMPVASNDTEAGRAKNRRVEIAVLTSPRSRQETRP